jgi:hypothetical protein
VRGNDAAPSRSSGEESSGGINPPVDIKISNFFASWSGSVVSGPDNDEESIVFGKKWFFWFISAVQWCENLARGFNFGFSRDFLFLVPEVLRYPKSYKKTAHFISTSGDLVPTRGHESVPNTYKVLGEMYLEHDLQSQNSTIGAFEPASSRDLVQTTTGNKFIPGRRTQSEWRYGRLSRRAGLARRSIAVVDEKEESSPDYNKEVLSAAELREGGAPSCTELVWSKPWSRTCPTDCCRTWRLPIERREPRLRRP